MQSMCRGAEPLAPGAGNQPHSWGRTAVWIRRSTERHPPHAPAARPDGLAGGRFVIPALRQRPEIRSRARDVLKETRGHCATAGDAQRGVVARVSRSTI